MFSFNDPKSVISVVNFLNLRFSPFYCPDSLLSNETLSGCFTVVKKFLLCGDISYMMRHEIKFTYVSFVLGVPFKSFIKLYCTIL
jgi:hypothetical protein